MNRMAMLALSLLVCLPVHGDILGLFNSDKLTDGGRYAFIPSTADALIIAIDAIDHKVAATIEIPHIASAVVATNELDLLVATHHETESATVVSLYDREIVGNLDLNMRPDVVLRNTYDRFVTFGSADGTVSTWDLSTLKEVLRVEGLSQATLLTFNFDGSQLFVVEPDRNAISVIDIVQKSVVTEISLGEGDDSVISALSRSADGFTGYVSLGSANRLVIIDLVTLKVKDTVAVGKLPIRPYSTADNRYVLVPNSGDATLTVYSPREQRVAATIPIGIKARDVNSGWLDTVAFVMPSEGDQIAVVDLQRLEAGTAISLPGRSDDGVVTADSKTLVTAVVDIGKVAIINARSRQIDALIDSGSSSLEGVDIALSNNVCH